MVTITKKKVGRPLGGVPWNKGMKGQYHIWPNGRKHTLATRKKLSTLQLEAYRTGKRVPYQKDKPQLNRRGIKNGNWKGGITGWDQTERTRIEFLMWSRGVKKVNKKYCVVCKSKNNLVSHHVKSFSEFPLLRYDIKNGVLVCRTCHPSVHKYGLEEMKKVGRVNLQRKCLTCKKSFSFTFYRIKTAYYCSKNCHYVYRREHSTWDKIKYRREWYRLNKNRILLREKLRRKEKV